jgi:Tol biopolymer transport system component
MISAKFRFFYLVLILAVFITQLFSQTPSQLFQQGLLKENGEGDLKAALAIYEKIVGDENANRSLRAKAQLHIGICWEKMGKDEAQKAYNSVIQEFADQQEIVNEARTRLAKLDRPERATELSGMVVRKVWEGLDIDDFCEISPDGKFLSYVDRETGDLAIYELATGKKRNLTNKGSLKTSNVFAIYSRWSLDGRQIVYDWKNKSTVELRIIGLDGSKPRILYRNEEVEWAETHDWSPDDKQILACFSRKDGTNQIVLVSAADGSVHVLKTLAGKGYESLPVSMSFSPDGRYIVYDFPQKENSYKRDISVLSTDGSREISLIKHPAGECVLGWAPDGKNILFASDRTGIGCIWLIAVAEGKPQGSPELIKPIMGLSWWMGFTRKGSFYYRFSQTLNDIYIAKLDMETGKILIPPKKTIKGLKGSNTHPRYSPDGKYLAYLSIRDAQPGYNSKNLCIYSIETGEKREFYPKFKRIIAPYWFPDSRTILFAGLDFNSKGWGHYQIDTQTGTITPILLPPEDSEQYRHEWSNDGKSLFQGRISKTDNVSKIMLRDIKSGTEKELYRASSNDKFYLSCSPDSKWLAFIKRGMKVVLRIIPASGGEPLELYRYEQEDESHCSFRWTPDGKYILLAIRQPGQNKCSLWRIPAEGGEPRKLLLEIEDIYDLNVYPVGKYILLAIIQFGQKKSTSLWRIPAEGGKSLNFGLEMNNINSLSVHPDGQHIVFSTRTREFTEVWAMENFLPE